MSSDTVLHEALHPVSWLAGRWLTESGKGEYPTIKEFTYIEELEFLCIGQPMLNYISISKHPEKKTPMHQERGFLRIKPGTNQVAFIVSHNFGMTSIEEGQIDSEKKELVLETSSINRMSFSKCPHVKVIRRSYRLTDTNTLEVKIAKPKMLHLHSIYKLFIKESKP